MKNTLPSLAWMILLLALPLTGRTQGPLPAAKPKPLAQRLNDILLPEVIFQDATVSTILDYLSHEGEKHDPDKLSINIVVLAQVSPDDKFTIRLKNVSLANAFKFVTQMTGLKYRLEPNAVIFFRESPAPTPSAEPPPNPTPPRPAANPPGDDSSAVAIRRAEMFEAARKNNTTALQQLITADPTLVNARNKQDETPLFLAAKAGNLAMVELLAKRGAGLDAACGQDAKIPLVVAMEGLQSDGRVGRAKMIEILLILGANPNAPDGEGRTPLWHAITYRIPAPLVELLIKKGADVNKADRQGDTPLHVAAAGNLRGSAELLLAKGADPRTKNSNGETPVETAANAGYIDLAKFLQTAPKTAPVPNTPAPTAPTPTVSPAVKQLPIAQQLKLVVTVVKVKNSNDRYLNIQLRNNGMNHLAPIVIRWKATAGNVKENSFDDETAISLKPLERIELQSHKYDDGNLRYLVEVLVSGELAASDHN